MGDQDYINFIKKIDEGLRPEDKLMCNYLLFEYFDITKHNLIDIFKALLGFTTTSSEAIELILASLYHLNIYRYHFGRLCPRDLAMKQISVSKKRWFFLKLYQECTEKEIKNFFDEVFCKTLSDGSCKHYLNRLSDLEIIFDETFMDIVNRFCDENKLPQVKKYLQECVTGIEFDGKRLCLSRESEVPHENRHEAGDHQNVYKIKDDRDNLCLIYCSDKRRSFESDSRKVADTFKAIRGFEVKIKPLTTNQELKESLNNEAKAMRQSDRSDMFVCFILSDGSDDKFCDQSGELISDSDVRKIFETENSPQLGEKPKIYIFDICQRNDNELVDIDGDEAINASEPEYDGVSGSNSQGNKKLSFGDYFICKSLIPGCSCPSSDGGSGFLSSLCDSIKNDSASKSLGNICMGLSIGSKKHICKVTSSTSADIYLDYRR